MIVPVYPRSISVYGQDIGFAYWCVRLPEVRWRRLCRMAERLEHLPFA